MVFYFFSFACYSVCIIPTKMVGEISIDYLVWLLLLGFDKSIYVLFPLSPLNILLTDTHEYYFLPLLNVQIHLIHLSWDIQRHDLLTLFNSIKTKIMKWNKSYEMSFFFTLLNFWTYPYLTGKLIHSNYLQRLLFWTYSTWLKLSHLFVKNKKRLLSFIIHFFLHNKVKTNDNNNNSLDIPK